MALAMNAAIKAELVERLRSGKYAQGKEKLGVKDDDGERFCCLGVLCEIAVERGIIKRFDQPVDCWDCEHPDDTVHKIEVHYDGSYDATLPQKVVDWAGIESVDIDYRSADDNFDDYEGMGRFESEQHKRSGNVEHASLAGMNDDGVPFTEIAQFIEDEVIAR